MEDEVIGKGSQGSGRLQKPAALTTKLFKFFLSTLFCIEESEHGQIATVQFEGRHPAIREHRRVALHHRRAQHRLAYQQARRRLRRAP